MLAEPVALIRNAIVMAEKPPEAVPLVSRVFTRETAEAYLKDAGRTGGQGSEIGDQGFVNPPLRQVQ
jgi:hypothetical protein